jgi:hypothetical protein
MIVCIASIVTAPLLLSMYGEVLSAANIAVLLSNLHKSLVHPVMADPWSIAPKTSQVGAKKAVLVRLKLQGKLADLQLASQDEQTLLSAKLAALDGKMSNYDANNIGDWMADGKCGYDEDMASDSYIMPTQWQTAESKLIWKQINLHQYNNTKWENIKDPTVTITLPNTPAKECLLSARQLLLDKQEQFEKANEAAIQLTRGIAALRTELPRWRRLLFFFSGNGRLLNQFRFACFLVVALALSSLLLFVSFDGSTGDPVGSEIDNDGVGLVYGMLQRHCDRVPANIDGAYFDFWTIWVLITAYCAASALFVSKDLLRNLAQELLEKAAGCMCFICCCRNTAATEPAGWLLLLCHRNVLSAYFHCLAVLRFYSVV